MFSITGSVSVVIKLLPITVSHICSFIIVNPSCTPNFFKRQQMKWWVSEMWMQIGNKICLKCYQMFVKCSIPLRYIHLTVTFCDSKKTCTTTVSVKSGGLTSCLLILCKFCRGGWRERVRERQRERERGPSHIYERGEAMKELSSKDWRQAEQSRSGDTDKPAG